MIVPDERDIQAVFDKATGPLSAKQVCQAVALARRSGDFVSHSVTDVILSQMVDQGALVRKANRHWTAEGVLDDDGYPVAHATLYCRPEDIDRFIAEVAARVQARLLLRARNHARSLLSVRYAAEFEKIVAKLMDTPEPWGPTPGD